MNRTIFPLMAVLALVSCARGGGSAEKSAAHYPTMTVTLCDKTLQSEYPATVQGRQSVEIRPQVSGIITKILIEEGSKVSRGQTLFIIDQVPYEAALRTAEASVKAAKVKLSSCQLTLESKRKLHESNVISLYELQMAENAVAEADAALALAQAQEIAARNNYSYTLVKSPVNGVAGMIPYREGALVGSSVAQPLVSVSDDSEVFAYFSMNERQFLGLSKTGALEFGQVGFIMSDDELFPESGRIGAVSGMVDPSTGSVSIKAVFPNKGGLLRSGSTGMVTIPIERKNCIVIPQSGTFEIQDKVFVYKVVDGKAVSARVKVYPLSDGKEYIVEDGLQEGDVIISEGAGLVREGARVSL